MWSQIEPTGAHLSFILLPFFLITYSLFSLLIRNRLHLSEPPLATLFGILIGPFGLGLVQPRSWGLADDTMIEITRVVAATQCFVVGIELPRGYMRRHWKSLLMLLGPVMTFGWLVCAGFIMAVFWPSISLPTALVIAACLTPTDPVLAASVLGGSSFAESVPRRIKNLLKAESGCNDGVAFPFLYVGISVLTRYSTGETLKMWVLVTLLYQCLLGAIVGGVIGKTAGLLMRFSEKRKYIGTSAYLMFYVLLAFFCIGVASTLGLDDFLVAFTAGIAFAQTDTFWERVEESKLPMVIDVQLNSAMFIYFGTDIPWDLFYRSDTAFYSLGRLVGLLVLILLFRRLPAVLAMKRFIPDLHTWGEAVFAGHFGPMGVGALFLALEARAQLETDTSVPLPDAPDEPNDLDPRRNRAIRTIWPIICFVVFGSIMVHGMSTLAISTANRFLHGNSPEEAPLLSSESQSENEVFDEEDQGEQSHFANGR